MAQVCTVIQADPNTFKAELETLAAANEIKLITKTKSAGKFLVIYDDAGTTGQLVEVIVGDPDLLSGSLTTIAATFTINIVSDTFSAAHYIVVYA